MLVRDVIKQAIATGYLSLEAENEIQEKICSTHCELEDLNAFMSLQLAAMAGRVKQQSLESINLPHDAEF